MAKNKNWEKRLQFGKDIGLGLIGVGAGTLGITGNPTGAIILIPTGIALAEAEEIYRKRKNKKKLKKLL